jgi:ubiquinone/menaquinone biosynthesis C-methylase UbiE
MEGCEQVPGVMDYAQFADLYDAFVKFEDDIPFFVSECLKSTGPVLELMAGSGRVTVPLLESGVELTCVDVCSDMLARLRSKLASRRLSAKVVRSDVRVLPFGASFELAILPFNSFSELVSEGERRLPGRSALRGLQRVRVP